MAEGEEVAPPNLNARAKVTVNASMDLLWTLLLDSLEAPILYDKNLQASRCLERGGKLDGYGVKRRDLQLLKPNLVLRHTMVVDPPQLRAPATEGLIPPGGSAEDVTTVFQKIKGEATEGDQIDKEEVLRALQDDELLRDFVGQIPALIPLVGQIPAWEDAFRATATSTEGMVSLPEFLALFAPPPPITSGSLTFPVEKTGPAGPRGAIEPEMEACTGTIVHEVRQPDPEDASVIEYIITVQLSVPQDPPPDLTPWVKRLALSMKEVTEKLGYLSPSLHGKNPIYSQALLHTLLKKAKRFKFMDPKLARSPSALGYYTRSPTPGQRDGFSPYPARPGSSLF